MSSQQFLSKRIAQSFQKNMIGTFANPTTVESYRKMIIFRCNNLGMKELDVSLGKWARENAQSLTLDECQQFEREVLDHETPDLFYLVLKNEIKQELSDYYANKFINELRNYATNGLKSL